MNAELPDIRPLDDFLGTLRIGAFVRVRHPEHHFDVQGGEITRNPHAHDDPDHIIDADGDMRIQDPKTGFTYYVKPTDVEVLS